MFTVSSIITISSVCFLHRPVASSSKRTTIRFADFKQGRYWFPLMVGIGLLVLQQFSGVNGIFFYSSNILANAAGHFPTGFIFVSHNGNSGTWRACGMFHVSMLLFVTFLTRESLSFYPVEGYGFALNPSTHDSHSMLVLECDGTTVLPVNIKGLAGSVATLAGVLACNNDCKLAHDLEQCRSPSLSLA
ncbi:hypothetical protein Peur_013301 [Populus x canadensis]